MSCKYLEIVCDNCGGHQTSGDFYVIRKRRIGRSYPKLTETEPRQDQVKQLCATCADAALLSVEGEA